MQFLHVIAGGTGQGCRGSVRADVSFLILLATGQLDTLCFFAQRFLLLNLAIPVRPRQPQTRLI